MKKNISLEMMAQPDNTSCGPTCLHSVYNYWGDEISLKDVISQVKQFEQGGGTLAVILGLHALMRGYDVELYSYNLNIFDPTWKFLSKDDLIDRLSQRLKFKSGDEKFTIAGKSYIHFLKEGGQIKFHEFPSEIIRKHLLMDNPILTGLSATYLYQGPRDHPITNADDPIGGEPVGHFVILCGFDQFQNEVLLADPYIANPFTSKHYYAIKMEKLIASIFLGIVTYDGNLLIIKPKGAT